MREELQTLVQLQDIDLHIRELEQRKAERPERMLALEEKAAGLEAEIAALKSRVEELEHRNRDVRLELKSETERLSRSQARLMEVKTNREYQALLKEIEELKKANKAREEEILNHETELGMLKEGLAEKEQEAAGIRAELETETKALETAAAKLDKEIAKLGKERRAVAEKVPPQLLRRYDFLKDKRAGVAVAAVVRAVCAGCNMNIPPQLYNDLLRDERVLTCPTCQRIIYAETESGEG
ncbi:hypothetical protein G3N55_04585 [Dissulfurirhabdus thermomarina]|uniref:Uncharacterized protein n=1 Tax=Dissulfurirhabdus thermomarina TaxID=1765737 RepID=A0A6N9TLG8_DISTH|nr:C4-type zinc ribbon domain-containing protein [Dissulfurirhabdus thermomarina]NDY42122.1 hypothetical protein [Dissulfurirhabdus thermomarina]NMX23133.1 hypothetical protein [Dissulfurirhabdus thermomarina]